MTAEDLKKRLDDAGNALLDGWKPLYKRYIQTMKDVIKEASDEGPDQMDPEIFAAIITIHATRFDKEREAVQAALEEEVGDLR